MRDHVESFPSRGGSDGSGRRVRPDRDRRCRHGAGGEAAQETQEAAAEIPENPIEATEESVRAGLRVYGRFCRSCHGIRGDGRGQNPSPGTRPANLIDDEWVHGDSDGEIYNLIRGGVPPAYDMDAWEGRITDEEIWHVVNFLRNLAERMNAR